jgi:uncharacterized protein
VSDAVILFIHFPEQGSVSPGLARDLGAELALELEVSFIRDLLDAARHSGSLPAVVGTGSSGAGPAGIFGDALRLLQHGRDAGVRRYNAFADLFSRGSRRAVMVCGNGPGVTAPLLRSAFVELDTHDAVLGPGRGGGYYLFGLNQGALGRELFLDVPWGTSREFMKTMARIESKSLEVSVLPQREEVRDREGLIRFVRDDMLSGDSAHVRACVERHRVEVFGKS